MVQSGSRGGEGRVNAFAEKKERKERGQTKGVVHNGGKR